MTAFGWYPDGWVLAGWWADGWWPVWGSSIFGAVMPVITLLSRIGMEQAFVAAMVVHTTVESTVTREVGLVSWVNEE